ncbi:hypothetical protein H072_4470 [Dactylellina haptotyla CBS 200.50]|uniref:Alpha 1,4-glycosyltransferase domain-containing protein n=1 Tax=Dactylellina haptotyla (strain CBS 200.50) TaxID=1284197 RepID=S8AEY2_DACHA|nr:hypothetical protein H072_4470 [Dactylellina haptotyla CBS 200.50]
MPKLPFGDTMIAPRPTGFWRPRVFAIITILVVGGIVIHQLRYIHEFVLAARLPELIEVLTTCSEPGPGFKPSNEADSHLRWHPEPNIPNVIHQIWKTSNTSTYAPGASRDMWRYVFEPLNYTVKLWPEDEILKLIETKYSWLLPTYNAYPYNIQRADLARLVIVHAEGGMYMDLDVRPRSVQTIQCLQHLGHQAIFASMAGTIGLSNHFFMAERGSSFLQWVLHEAKRRGPTSRWILLPYLQVFWSTGPMMLTSAFHKYAKAYETEDQRLAVLTEGYGKTAFGHQAGRSWHGWDGKFLNYLADSPQLNNLWVNKGSYIGALALYKTKKNH